MYNQNKNYELSYAELRKMKGYENVSEEEAAEIIYQLKELSNILFDIFTNQSSETKTNKRVKGIQLKIFKDESNR